MNAEQNRILHLLEAEALSDPQFMRVAQDVLLKAAAHHAEQAIGLRFKAVRNADGGLDLKRQ